MTNPNEPAYPSEKEWSEGGKDFLDAPVIVNRQSFGLTKREYFAAMALQGMYSNHCIVDQFDSGEVLSKEAVKIADALIEQLNKTI